jgi:SOS-response transcriptional repressor LexA
MKAGAANKDINAWSIISKWLLMKGKRQTDLAVLLNITASAVSQIKSGSILLNAKQISLILEYLKIDSHDMCALYTLIFNARLTSKVDSDKNLNQKLIVNIANLNNEKDFSIFSEVKDSSPDCQDSFHRVPLMTFKQAVNYEPALESIDSFARDCSEQTVLFSNAQVGNLALFVDEKSATPEFAHSAVLLVAGKEYPAHGDMVVAKLRTGEVITKYYLRQDDVIHLKSKNPCTPSFTWHYQEDPGYVQWMYPIIEVNLKLRPDSYNFDD